jgi:hypothetical protein
MRQVWAAALGVLSVVATVCVVTVGADVLQAGSFSRALFGDYVEVFSRGPPRVGVHAASPPEPVPLGSPQPVQPGSVGPDVTVDGPERDLSNRVGPPPAAREAMEAEGALDLVIPDWMARKGEPVEVRFQGGRTHTLPHFTRVAPGMFMLEFSSPSFRPVLCQVQVKPRSRSRVTFGGQNCRVELND